MKDQLYRLAVTSVLALICAASALAKRVDDVVVLKNGDRLTGEIKSLQRGELRFKADYMAEAVRLDWTRVERLASKDKYFIFLTNGELFRDCLDLNSSESKGAENFVIGRDATARRINQMEVMRILPMETKFWRQLEGSVDFGFSFNSGNDQYQTELLASSTYRTGAHTFTAQIDSAFSGQSEGSRTARNQFTFDYRKQLSDKWYIGGLFDVLQSDQQSLDRRTTFGALVGRQIKQTESMRFSVFGGLAGSRENYSVLVNQPRTMNADAAVGFDFTTFHFKTIDIKSRLITFPSLTTPGRLRLQTTSDLHIQIVKDLYWGFHVYENFDGKPPVSANKNDLGVSTSLGWKF